MFTKELQFQKRGYNTIVKQPPTIKDETLTFRYLKNQATQGFCMRLKLMTPGLTAIFLALAACKQHQTNYLEKAIYGKDDRVSPHKHSDATLRKLSQAVVLLTTSHSTPVTDGGFCSGAIFEYASKKFLLTAGHCLKTQQKCDDTFLVFNYEDNWLSNQQLIVKCQQLLFTTQKPDVAIATISAPVYGKFNTRQMQAIPLLFSNPQTGSSLAVIGHPEGGVKKIADACKVEKRADFAFYHQCDTFSGNSGSPVFNLDNHHLVGILVAGRTDKNADGNNRVYRYGHEIATDLSIFQRQFVDVLNGLAPPREGIYADDGRSAIPTQRQIVVRCDDSLPSSACRKQVIHITKIIYENFYEEKSIDKLGHIYVENTPSRIAKNHLDIEISASKAVISNLLSTFVHLQSLIDTYKDINGISLTCNYNLDPLRCEKSLKGLAEVLQRPRQTANKSPAGIIRSLQPLQQFNAQSLKCNRIYIEEDWAFNRSWIDVKAITYDKTVEQWQKNVVAKLKQRVDSSKFAGMTSQVAGLTIAQGNKVSNADYQIARARIKQVLSANVKFNAISLDASYIYIEAKPSRVGTFWINIKYDATIDEIEAILRKRYTNQDP